MPILPKQQTDNRDLSLMQSAWASILDPLLQNPSLQSVIVKDVALSTTPKAVNHRLGRKPQGWRIVDANSGATVYRTAPFDPLTLTLEASAPITVSLEVF